MNSDIENIASTNQSFLISIYDVINDSYCGVVKGFSKMFQNQCENNPNEPQNMPSEVKAALKQLLWKQVVWTSGYDPPKGVR